MKKRMKKKIEKKIEKKMLGIRLTKEQREKLDVIKEDYGERVYSKTIIRMINDYRINKENYYVIPR